MGKIVRLILLNILKVATAEDAVLVLPPRVSAAVTAGLDCDASEAFRCLTFEVVMLAIDVGVFIAVFVFLDVPVRLFFEGKESAVPARTVNRWWP
jgi:hypothetical protein